MPLRNLRKLWSNSKQKTILEIENDCEKRADCGDAKKTSPQLPLLQVWPSQDSPEKIQSSSQHFVFNCEDLNNVHQNDSGIDSTQASPSPRPSQCYQSNDDLSPTPSNKSRQTSCLYLHPNHARLIKTCPPSDQIPVEETMDSIQICSGSSSTTSSMTSISGAIPKLSARHSDPWDRRRSSIMTIRFSMISSMAFSFHGDGDGCSGSLED
ncbi:hypothetical protein PGB90_007067 [Kerria lacca]